MNSHFPAARKLAVACTLSLSVSGCFTMAGAPELDLMIFGGAAAALGVSMLATNALDNRASSNSGKVSMGTVSSNLPANNGEPVLEDPQAAFYYQRLRSFFADNPSTATLFASQTEKTAVHCDFTENARSLLLFQSPPDTFADRIATQNRQNNTDTAFSSPTVRLLQGECADGMPEGRFVALGSYHTTMRGSGYDSETASQLLVEGTITNGMMDGEFSILRQDVSTGSFVDGALTAYSGDLGVYRENMPIGFHVNYRPYGVDLTTVVFENLGEEYRRQSLYQNGNLSTVAYLRDMSVLDGWMSYHSGFAPGTRNCFRAGQQANNSYCNTLDAQLVSLTSESPDFRSLASEDANALFPLQRIVGIGVQLTATDNGYISVHEVFPGSPAAEAGLMTNDRLVDVAGVNVIGLPLADVLPLIQGDADTTVSVTVNRSGQKEPLVFTVQRATIFL